MGKSEFKPRPDSKAYDLQCDLTELSEAVLDPSESILMILTELLLEPVNVLVWTFDKERSHTTLNNVQVTR